MKMVHYAGLMLVSLLAAIGAIVTLIPAAGASYQNLLGYRSLCTFAPAATLFCCFIAGASCVIRASMVKRKSLYGKTTFKKVPVVIVASIFALAVSSTIWFAVVDARYPDGVTSASSTE